MLASDLVDASVVAVDQALIPALGPPQSRHRKRRRGADLQAGWGYSEHHGWVYGYSMEVVVAATNDSIVVPLLGSVGPGNTNASGSFLVQVDRLPSETRDVLADRAYDTNACGEAVEYDSDDEPTDRHLVCPLIGRAGKPKVGRQQRRGTRERSRQRRLKRLAFFESPEGQRLYSQRAKTVEPFIEWFKQKFDLHAHVWHRGLDNNRTQMMGALCAYQLLVRYHHHLGGTNACIQWILDRL